MEYESSSHEESNFEPTKEEVDRFLNRLEKGLPLSQLGNSNDKSMPDERENGALDRSFYERACEKATTFIPAIDPDLRVSMEAVDVTPDDPASPDYTTLALRFSHRSKPYIDWTMEIEKSDRYLDGKFEEVVRTIYQRKSKGM